MARHSAENVDRSAAGGPSAPLAHFGPSERSTAHPGTSQDQPAGWHWTDIAMIGAALTGLALLIVTMIWALTLPTLSVHYDSVPARSDRPADLVLPAPPPAPIPLVLAQHDDPRAVVWVPNWTAVAR